jgi:hypothetical protein
MARPRAGRAALRGVHVLVFALWILFGSAVSGNLWGLGLVLSPLAATLGLTYLARAQSRCRVTRVTRLGLAAALLSTTATITCWAWRASVLSVVWEVNNGHLGPNGGGDALLLIWGTLFGAVGGAVLSALGGKGSIWSATGWYAWTSPLIALLAFLSTIGYSDRDYLMEEPLAAIPYGLLSRALLTFLLLLPFAAVSRLRGSRVRGSQIPA